MSTIKRHLDESDATESSSGGESEEEAEFDSQLIQHYKSIPLWVIYGIYSHKLCSVVQKMSLISKSRQGFT